MEIKNYASALSSYKANSYEKINREKQPKSFVAKNMDKVEFSSVKPQNINTLKASIAQSIDTSPGYEKIMELKNQINNREYFIPTELISKAIIDG